MIRAQQEKGKPQAKPPSLEERVSSKPAGAPCMSICLLPLRTESSFWGT